MRTSPPPLAVQVKADYLTLAFRAKPSDIVTLSHGLVIGSSGSHSSPTSAPPTSHPSATSRLEHRVISVFLFLNCCAFFGGLPFALLCFQSELLWALFLLANCRESSSLFWPFGPPTSCLGCCPPGWQPDSPLALSLRLLASAELCSTGPASPPDHRENHLIWVDSIPVIPLAWSRMSLERLVGTRKIPTTLVTLSLQLWS